MKADYSPPDVHYDKRKKVFVFSASVYGERFTVEIAKPSDTSEYIVEATGYNKIMQAYWDKQDRRINEIT